MKYFHTLVLIAFLVGVPAANAAIVTIDNLDIRQGGVFGAPHTTNVSSITFNGVAPNNTVVSAPTIDTQITYNNLDLDGDGSANDTVIFTLQANALAPATNVRAMNQGFDTGFGNLDGIEFSVVNVSGTTTDLGNTIVFDGFTGATAAAGFNGAIDTSIDVNGVTNTLNNADTGAFQFLQSTSTFAPTATLTFDNSVVNGGGGTAVARNYDLQFSTIPEPTFGFIGLGLLGLIASGRRRRRLVSES